MSVLARVELALIDDSKLAGYALDPGHPRGRNKARVFRAALGIGPEDAAWLRAEILARLPAADAEIERVDGFGARYRVDLPIAREGRRAMVRTVWLVAAEGTAPRLVTCYVL